MWCWVWDRRVMCGLRHGKAFFMYLWIVPFLVSLGTLPYAALVQYSDGASRILCNTVPEVKESGETLQVLIYLEESLLFLSIFASLGMIFKTRSIYKRFGPKSGGKVTGPFD